MSQENLNAVRKSYEAFNRRDYESLFEFYDSDIVWEQAEGFVEPGTHRGHEGVRHVFASIFESFDEFRVEVQRLVDIDNDRVLALVRVAASGRGSGLEVNDEGGHIWTLRDGKGVKVKMFTDPAAALAAAGVSKRATG
jgi:ketosteroid isomerase-like protein